MNMTVDLATLKIIQEYLEWQRRLAGDPWGICRCCYDDCDCGCIETCPLHKAKADTQEGK